MRYTLILLLLIAFIPAATSQTPKSGAAVKAEESVRKLERAWLDAYEQNDAKAMDTIVADDFVITFPDGSLQTKPQLMEQIRRPRSPSNPAPRFSTEDVKVRVYGDTVILMGLVISEYQRQGKTSKEQSRYTDTYVKQNGRWQVVASHLSNVAPPPKPAATPSPQ